MSDRKCLITPRRRRFPAAPLASLLCLAVCVAAFAQPTRQLRQLNDTWSNIPQSDRIEDVLVPALAAMNKAPAGAGSTVEAAWLTPDAGAWSDALAWADAPGQRAALEALKQVSERRSRFVFAQPYGRAAGESAIAAGLYVDLGEPELIANARSGWIAGLDRLGALANIEATRLAASGAGADALDLVLRWIRLARAFGDRELFAEKRQSYRWMRFGIERLRDLAYLFPSGADDQEMRAVIRSLEERELNLDRMLLPRGDRLAAEELLALTFLERGGPNPETFGPTMARMQSGDRPLRLFAEASRWRTIGEQHADFFATRDRIEAVFRDWQLRWGLGPRDIVLQTATDFERLDRGRFMLIAASVPDVGELLQERFALRVELGGTRLALAVAGYRAWTGAWPDPVFAVRPRLIAEIPVDPWDPAGIEPYRYFIPMREPLPDERATPRPHTINIVGAGDAPAGPQPPTEAEVFSWLSRGGTQLPTNSQMLRQAAQSIPEQVPPQMRDRLRTAIARAIEQSGAGEAPEWVSRLAGARSGDQRSPAEIQADAILRITLSPDYRRTLLSLADQENPSMEDIRVALAGVVLRMLGSGANGPGAGTGSALYEIPSFEGVFDDSVFVLYSVGSDETPGRATNVGPGGNDHLIWPPLFSLVREQAGR